MDLSGFSSPRFNCFPAGLRVLVVDDDATWLKILEKMLKKCNYEVTTCNLARDALNLLRERKNAFDIVISDVTMPDMDGFKLLEHIGLEMDLPVIMMSVDGETSRVMKGVQHGACDYLLKPIRMKELRNIWQHVYRKRMNEVRDAVDVHDSNLEELHLMGRHHEQSDDVYVFARDLVSGKRRKYADDSNDKNGECRACGDSHSAKRARVVWTIDLHQKFVRAVNQIGFEKVGPKKILDLMGVPWLTRENVASHLQKYRLYLSRLEKEDELKGTYSEDFDSGHKISSHSCDPKLSEPNVNRAFPVTLSEPETSLIQDRPDVSRNTTSSSPSFNKSTDTLLNPRYDSKIQHPEHSWSPEMSSSLEADHKTHLTAHHTSDKPVVSSNKLMEKVVTQVKNTSALFSIQSKESPLRDFQETEETRHSLWTSDVKSSQGNLILDTGSSINLWDEEFETYSSHVDFFPRIGDLTHIQSLGHSSQEWSGGDDTQHTEWSFDCEYPNESVEYPTIDKGLFVYSLT